jgi:hypothetical protein
VNSYTIKLLLFPTPAKTVIPRPVQKKSPIPLWRDGTSKVY